MPAFRLSEWNEIIRRVNDLAQNPPQGCNSPLEPLPEAGPNHKWSLSDVRSVQDTLKQVCSENVFSETNKWKQSIIDEINDGIAKGWCDCGTFCAVRLLESTALGSWYGGPIYGYLESADRCQAMDTEQRTLARTAYSLKLTWLAIRAQLQTAPPEQRPQLEAQAQAAEAAYRDAQQQAENKLDELNQETDNAYRLGFQLVPEGAGRLFNYLQIMEDMRGRVVEPIDDPNTYPGEQDCKTWELWQQNTTQFPNGALVTSGKISRSGRLIPQTDLTTAQNFIRGYVTDSYKGFWLAPAPLVDRPYSAPAYTDYSIRIRCPEGLSTCPDVGMVL